ncbi:hypothetical protein [Streptosporangium lutulentum]|uniref:Uncharacterized protein n=1 Tax=Streptosporangium lutulentum TaxID=1461250 RepID=A0ABT9QDZ5_9ACTN|nr:hypothetical protein [Streptosporangium lutulentum]MDP9844889.1 hypothetical protein [Streptosporangium lutulentum]
MRQLLVLSLAALFVLSACAEDPAVRAAYAHADRVAEELSRGLSWNREDIGHGLSRDEDVDVYSVTGTRYSLSDRGRVLLRIRATSRIGPDGMPDPVGQGTRAYEATHDPSPSRYPVVTVCFEITVSYSDTGVTEVECPAGEPHSFRAPAALPHNAFDRLKTRLPKTPDLAAARKVVDHLDLDDRIGKDVAEMDGVIGIALRERPGVCLFARVRPQGTEVWWPSRIQAMPGESSCSAAEAVHGHAQRAPH